MHRKKEDDMDLAIYEGEKFKRNVMEVVINGSNDGFDSAFNGLNTGFQRTGVVLGVFVDCGEADHSVQSCYLYEIQVLEILCFALNLQVTSS